MQRDRLAQLLTSKVCNVNYGDDFGDDIGDGHGDDLGEQQGVQCA